MEIGNSKSSKNIPFPSSFQVTFLQFPYSLLLWYRPAKNGKQFDNVIMKCHKICLIKCLKTPLSIAHIVSVHCQSSFYWFYFKTFRQLKKKHIMEFFTIQIPWTFICWRKAVWKRCCSRVISVNHNYPCYFLWIPQLLDCIPA